MITEIKIPLRGNMIKSEKSRKQRKRQSWEDSSMIRNARVSFDVRCLDKSSGEEGKEERGGIHS